MDLNRQLLDIHRRLTGRAPAADDYASAESKLHREVEKLWNHCGDYQNGHEPDVEAAWTRLAARRSAETPRVAARSTSPRRVVPLHRRTWARVAVAALLLVAGGWFAYQGNFATGNEPVVITATDSPVEQILPDGTRVLLNADSRLSYELPFDRKISVRGEGFFDVARDESAPFLIETPDSEIRVLGTAFNLRAYPAEKCVEVHVTEGKVQFDCKANNESMVLTESMRATLGFSDMKMKKITDETGNALAWQRGSLKFRQTKFETALQDMERFYGVNIDLENEQLSDCHLNGTYKREDWNTLVGSLELALGVEIHESDGNVKISGGGCN